MKTVFCHSEGLHYTLSHHQGDQLVLLQLDDTCHGQGGGLRSDWLLLSTSSVDEDSPVVFIRNWGGSEGAESALLLLRLPLLLLLLLLRLKL